ncbi:hypothetical protein NDA00_26650 [Funiculus sociatus GB2-M2]|uniref:hypothetical protein n=1 Tax=Funiculus sociatus TaxID=450527 RepID=UPI0032997E9D
MLASGCVRGLWEAAGRGRQGRWSEDDWQALAQWVKEPRRYSAAQLSHKQLSHNSPRSGKWN